MKKCCLLILAIASAMLVPAQSKPRPGPPKPLSEEEWEKDERNRECVFSKKFTAEQRSKFYPFNKAKEVRIVSFRKLDSLVDEQLPMANGIVDTSHFTESKTLNGRQRNLLSDILYNYKYRGIFHIDVKSLCYNPRNAVVFFDSKSRGFAFIEICFECDSYRLSSKRIRTGDFCEGKFDLLQEFFLKNGIRDGTVRDPEAND